MFAAWFYSSERKFSYRTHRHERRNGRKNILFGLISSPNSFPLLVFRETKSRAFRPEMFAFLGLLLTWAGKLFADRRFYLSSSRLSFHEWYHVLRDCLKFCNAISIRLSKACRNWWIYGRNNAIRIPSIKVNGLWWNDAPTHDQHRHYMEIVWKAIGNCRWGLKMQKLISHHLKTLLSGEVQKKSFHLKENKHRTEYFRRLGQWTCLVLLCDSVFISSGMTV